MLVCHADEHVDVDSDPTVSRGRARGRETARTLGADSVQNRHSLNNKKET